MQWISYKNILEMKKDDLATICVCYVALSLAYILDKTTRAEWLLSLSVIVWVYILLMLCRIYHLFETIKKQLKDEEDNVQ